MKLTGQISDWIGHISFNVILIPNWRSHNYGASWSAWFAVHCMSSIKFQLYTYIYNIHCKTCQGPNGIGMNKCIKMVYNYSDVEYFSRFMWQAYSDVFKWQFCYEKTKQYKRIMYKIVHMVYDNQWKTQTSY